MAAIALANRGVAVPGDRGGFLPQGIGQPALSMRKSRRGPEIRILSRVCEAALGAASQGQDLLDVQCRRILPAARCPPVMRPNCGKNLRICSSRDTQNMLALNRVMIA